jgi:hypothetical protein
MVALVAVEDEEAVDALCMTLCIGYWVLSPLKRAYSKEEGLMRYEWQLALLALSILNSLN